MKPPAVSIIIATYNSERTLRRTLDSVKAQSIAQNKLEIILVDGGSKDKTRQIAKKYKCRLIDNPMVEPLHAKYIGFIAAKGAYVIGLDHDEVFVDKKSLERRLKVFTHDTRVRSIHSSGYITPRGSNFINHYVNEFGDPFSLFIYRLTKDYRFFIPTLRRRYDVIHEDGNYLLIRPGPGQRTPLMEVLAGGAMVDRRYVLKKLKKLVPNKNLFLPHLHLHLLSLSPYIAVMKNDPLYHYSAENLQKYLHKLEWRIRNNIYFNDTAGSAGFLKREHFENKRNSVKKFLFIPYSVSLIFPMFDALWLSITRRNVAYMIHVLLCLYASVLIVYHMARKTVGLKPVLQSYDGLHKILRPWR